MPASAPAAGERVGIQLHKDGEWLPAIYDKTDERGDLLFLWPDGQPRSSSNTHRFALRLHWAWDWKPARKVKFMTWCRRCYGHGAYAVPKGSKFKKTCEKCAGYGFVPDKSPFARKK